MIAIPITLWIMPVSFFDSGESICLSRVIFDVKCYACGMTRGVMHLMHFDFEGAASFNKLSFLVLPVLFMFWLKTVLGILGVKILKWF
jgi:hypothetical protein